MRKDKWITVAIWKATKAIAMSIQRKQKKESPTKKDCESLGQIVHKGVELYAQSQDIDTK